MTITTLPVERLVGRSEVRMSKEEVAVAATSGVVDVTRTIGPVSLGAGAIATAAIAMAVFAMVVIAMAVIAMPVIAMVEVIVGAVVVAADETEVEVGEMVAEVVDAAETAMEETIIAMDKSAVHAMGKSVVHHSPKHAIRTLFRLQRVLWNIELKRSRHFQRKQ